MEEAALPVVAVAPSMVAAGPVSSERLLLALASAIDVTRFRLLAFVLSSFLAGAAGIGYLYYVQAVAPTALSLELSLTYVLDGAGRNPLAGQFASRGGDC